ncbi:MAG TPA: hypothetical protein VIQ04_01135 [Nitrososphaeraceae archaeon]
MNTHIIIPIKDIESEIEILKLEQEGSPTMSRLSKIVSLTDILMKGKQISLDEKDIEEKATKAIEDKTKRIPVPTSIWMAEIRQYEECYKQALKDLL